MAKDLHAAVLALQSEIGTLQKNALNPHFKSRYISLDSLVEHVQPLLTKHGLTWVTFPDWVAPGGTATPVLRYVLTHVESGAAVDGTMPLLLDKQNAQGQGSAITYARRYALCAVLNIVADVDDDGEKAVKQKKTTAGTPGANDAASFDFAAQMRATKMKANDIKSWLLTEGGFDQAGIDAQPTLKDLLNNLDEGTQTPLLAWANG